MITSEFAEKDSLKMSGSAIKLFIALNKIESIKEACGELNGAVGQRWFLCTDGEIRGHTGMNVKSIQSAKKELKEHGFIDVSRGNWHYKQTGKSDIRQPCRYQILK